MLGPRIKRGRADRARRSRGAAAAGSDVSEAARIAAELDRLTASAGVIEQAAEAQAEARGAGIARARRQGRGHRNGLRRLAPGIVGLVASRLKEKFARPAFAIALEPGGIGTGSGRSISGRSISARRCGRR